ncbi:MAG: hypothetical protein ACE5K4_07095 [Candidatus Hydrothermarchaeota archaeon]
MRGYSAEKIAGFILESMGYKVLEKNVPVTIDGIEVSEVDFIVEKDGESFAVEAKSGNANVSDIRQAYSNAKLIGKKPLIVCKDFSDISAESLAKEFEVEVIRYSRIFLVEPEEIYNLLRRIILDVIEEYGVLRRPVFLKEEEKIHLEKIVSVERPDEIDNLGEILNYLRKEGVLPSRSLRFIEIKRIARALLDENKFYEKLEKIERKIDQMDDLS